jgi:hypothetical protein
MSEWKLPISRFQKPYVDRSTNEEWWEVFDADGNLVMRLPCMVDLAHDPSGCKVDDIIRAVNSRTELTAAGEELAYRVDILSQILHDISKNPTHRAHSCAAQSAVIEFNKIVHPKQGEPQ